MQVDKLGRFDKIKQLVDSNDSYMLIGSRSFNLYDNNSDWDYIVCRKIWIKKYGHCL